MNYKEWLSLGGAIPAVLSALYLGFTGAIDWDIALPIMLGGLGVLGIYPAITSVWFARFYLTSRTQIRSGKPSEFPLSSTCKLSPLILRCMATFLQIAVIPCRWELRSMSNALIACRWTT
jgi:hypothetical protein